MNLLDTLPGLEKPVMICVEAEHMGECQLMKPLLEDIQFDFSQSLDFITVDFKQQLDFQKAYCISKYPSILIFREGELLNKLEGLISRSKLYQLLDLLLA